MDDDDAPDQAFADFKTRNLGVWGVAQIAAGTGLAVYAMWVGIFQPGFRKVPLKLQVWSKSSSTLWINNYLIISTFFLSEAISTIFQVPYMPASKAQVNNVMTLLRGRKGGLVDLGSGDGRIVSIIRTFGLLPLALVNNWFWLWSLKVLEAHRQGFTPAIGYELNPWLVSLSRFHAWRAGHHEKVSYRREDLWKVCHF